MGFTAYGNSWCPKRCSCLFLFMIQCLRQHVTAKSGIPDQTDGIYTLFQTKMAKSIPYFRLEMLENGTLWGSPPSFTSPPPLHSEVLRITKCLTRCDLHPPRLLESEETEGSSNFHSMFSDKDDIFLWHEYHWARTEFKSKWQYEYGITSGRELWVPASPQNY